MRCTSKCLTKSTRSSGGKPSGKPTGRRPAGASKQKKKALSAKWLFDAALLSSPVDLTALVELSQKSPDAVLSEVGLLNRMVRVTAPLLPAV